MTDDQQGLTLEEAFQLISRRHPRWREYQELLADPDLEVAWEMKRRRNRDLWKHRGEGGAAIAQQYDELLMRKGTIERTLRDFFIASMCGGEYVATGYTDRADASSKVDIRPEAWKHAFGSLVGDDVKFGPFSQKKRYFDVRLRRRPVVGHGGGGPRGTEARTVEKRAEIWLRENARTYDRGQKRRVLADLRERFPTLSGRAMQRVWDNVANDHGWTRGGRPNA